MRFWRGVLGGILVFALLVVLFPSIVRAAVDGELQFVLNTFSFLFWGALVMWMCPGFTMLEAGSVRTKNSSVICLKNIGLYSIAGLVAITAGPDIVDHHWAVIIGAVGGGICTLGMKVLERLRIDDEVGAIPAHMGAGVWGTLAVCIAAGGDPLIQLIGVVAIGAFVFGASLLVWRLIDWTLGARITRGVEVMGQDIAELGIEAFPEFLPQREDLTR